MLRKRYFFELDEYDRGRRGHDQKLFKKGFRLDVKSLLSVRSVNDWNSLILIVTVC